MNPYEERQIKRRERYAKLAERLENEAQQVYDNAHAMASVIPFGQPIMVGHHSEKRDRNYRDKIHNTFGKAFKTFDKAKYFKRKAESESYIISSDDPQALEKLTKKLEQLEKDHEFMKACNKAIRSNKTHETRMTALLALGADPSLAHDLLKPDFANRVGYASFSLTNSNQRIKQVKDRIASIQSTKQRDTQTIEGKDWTCKQDPDDNRIHFYFTGKPDQNLRTLLKSNGFKWSPIRGAWIRQLTNNAVYVTKHVIIPKLNEL